MMIFMNNNEKNMAQPNKNHYFRQCKKKWLTDDWALSGQELRQGKRWDGQRHNNFICGFMSFWKELNHFSTLAHSNKKGP